jgi:hypothetical protein
MKTCGTCLHCRIEEEYGISGGCIEHYHCVDDQDKLVSYHQPACKRYQLDEEYMKFMGFTMTEDNYDNQRG